MGRQVVYKPLMVSSLILMKMIGIPLIFTIVIKKIYLQIDRNWSSLNLKFWLKI